MLILHRSAKDTNKNIILLNSKFYVKNGKHGLGCFASRFIRKGERIMVFKGPLITYAQTKTKEHKDHYFQIGLKSFQ